MNDFTSQILEEFHNLCASQPHQALALLRKWEKEGVNDPNLLLNKPGFLIDIGSTLRDAAVIQEGVDLLEADLLEVECQGRRFSASSWFNLGNGHYAAEDARRGRNGYIYAPTDTPMTRAKQCYRNALAELARSRQDSEDGVEDDEDDTDSEDPSRLETELLVNYGNSLNELGRVLEALDLYEEALERDPQHPMAWGRLGDTLFDFAQFVRAPQLVKEAVNAFRETLKDNRLDSYGYGHVRAVTKRDLAKAQAQLRAVESDRGQHQKPSVPSPYHEEFVTFCTQRRLFLNLSLRRLPSPHPYEDKFDFSVVTPISDQERFPRLVRTLNELVERFAIARLLLFEAHQPPCDTAFYETITRYIDLNDASVYGIRAAKLKLAYESAFNVLDKLALFLNDYLELGLNKKHVNFSTVWSEKSGTPNAVLRQSLLDRQNPFLFALYDLSCDFGKNARGEEGEWSHYKETRNLLTHRYLVLHAFEWDWQIVDGPEHHREWESMVNATESLLYLTRNALIYGLLAVQLEEARAAARKEAAGGKIIERLFHLHATESGLI